MPHHGCCEGVVLSSSCSAIAVVIASYSCQVIPKTFRMVLAAASLRDERLEQENMTCWRGDCII